MVLSIIAWKIPTDLSSLHEYINIYERLSNISSIGTFSQNGTIMIKDNCRNVTINRRPERAH